MSTSTSARFGLQLHTSGSDSWSRALLMDDFQKIDDLAVRLSGASGVRPAAVTGNKGYLWSTDHVTALSNGKRWIDIPSENVYNVRDFGAVGDGITNDTVAFRNCFAAAVQVGVRSESIVDPQAVDGTGDVGGRIRAPKATLFGEQTWTRPLAAKVRIPAGVYAIADAIEVDLKGFAIELTIEGEEGGTWIAPYMTAAGRHAFRFVIPDAADVRSGTVVKWRNVNWGFVGLDDLYEPSANHSFPSWVGYDWTPMQANWGVAWWSPDRVIYGYRVPVEVENCKSFVPSNYFAATESASFTARNLQVTAAVGAVDAYGSSVELDHVLAYVTNARGAFAGSAAPGTFGVRLQGRCDITAKDVWVAGCQIAFIFSHGGGRSAMHRITTGTQEAAIIDSWSGVLTLTDAEVETVYLQPYGSNGFHSWARIINSTIRCTFEDIRLVQSYSLEAPRTPALLVVSNNPTLRSAVTLRGVQGITDRALSVQIATSGSGFDGATTTPYSVATTTAVVVRNEQYGKVSASNRAIIESWSSDGGYSATGGVSGSVAVGNATETGGTPKVWVRKTGGTAAAGGTVIWTFHFDTLGLNAGGASAWALGPTAGQWLASLSKSEFVTARTVSLTVSGPSGINQFPNASFSAGVVTRTNETVSLGSSSGGVILPYIPVGNDYSVDLVVTDTISSSAPAGTLIPVQATLQLVGAAYSIWPAGQTWSPSATVTVG